MMLTRPEAMSVALMQHEKGTPQRSTDGDEQLKYSFFDQSMYPSEVSPQHWN
jgi:hypothetical protein